MRIKRFLLYVLVLFLMFTIAFITKVNVNAAENGIYLVNENGVEITNDGYQKLLSVGYVESELNTITINEY